MKYFFAGLVFILLMVGIKIVRAQSTVPPTVPQNISAVLLSSQQVYVSWDSSNSTSSIIGGYYLYRDGAFIANVPGYTYYTDTPGGGVFTYTVAAYDANGNISPQSNPTSAVTVVGDTTPPTMPTGLTVIPSSSSVVLSWQPSTDNIGVIGYYISRNGVRIQTTDPISNTSYTDSGLKPGQTYTYTVSAYDASRNVSSAAAIQATTIYDVAPPSVPTKIVATAVSPSEIDLAWQPSSDNIQVGGYNIYENGTEAATLVGTTTSYAATGLSPQTNYTFNISAYDELGNTSVESFPPVSTTTWQLDLTPPTTPRNLIATAIDPTDVVLSWQPSTDNVAVGGYDIYRGGTQIATVTATTTYEDSGLATGTYYIYDIVAYDTSNNISGPVYQTVTTPAYETAPSSSTTPTATTTSQVVTPPPPDSQPTTVITASTTTIITPPCCKTISSSFVFTTTLSFGQRNAAVTNLQNILIQNNYLGSNYGTGYYGLLTQKAVQAFQCAQKIVCSGTPRTTGWGSVGPRTRAALNSF